MSGVGGPGFRRGVGSRLRQLRLDARASQEDVGGFVGVSPRAICNYEKGRREPPLSTAQRLADFFGVPVDALLPDGAWA